MPLSSEADQLVLGYRGREVKDFREEQGFEQGG